MALAITAMAQAWVLVFTPRHVKVGLAATFAIAIAVCGGGLVKPLDVLLGMWVDAPILMPLAVPVCFAIGVAGINVNRCRAAESNRIAAVQRFHRFELANAHARRFRNTAEAQRWYEWRRLGWHLPALQCGFIAIYFLLVPAFLWASDSRARSFWAFFDNWSRSRESVNIAFVLAVLLPAAVAGYIMMAFDSDKPNNYRAFLFTRPRSTSFLMRARYAAVAKNALLGYLPLVGLLWYFASYEGTRNALASITHGELGEITWSKVLVLAAVPFLVSWTMQCTPNIIAAIGGLAVFVALYVWLVAASADNAPPDEFSVQIAFDVSTVAYAVILTSLFVRVARRGLKSGAIPLQTVLWAAGIWLVVIAGIAMHGSLRYLINFPFTKEPGWQVPFTFLFIITLLPPAVLITAPYLLHRSRHRV